MFFFYCVILHGCLLMLGYDTVWLNYPQFQVNSHSFPLIPIIFRFLIFPKFPSLTSHGNLPESFWKFTGNFPPLCNPSQESLYQPHSPHTHTGPAWWGRCSCETEPLKSAKPRELTWTIKHTYTISLFAC